MIEHWVPAYIVSGKIVSIGQVKSYKEVLRMSFDSSGIILTHTVVRSHAILRLPLHITGPIVHRYPM